MRNIKQINIKNRTYYFFNDTTNNKVFYSNLLKIDNKSYKTIDTITLVIMKNISDYQNIHSVNLLYLMVSGVDG